jgi:hypothetical protein
MNMEATEVVECPFDLESPVMVWKFNIPPNPGPFDCLCYLTVEDAMGVRDLTGSVYLPLASRQPTQIPLSDLIVLAKYAGNRCVRIVDGNDKVIEEYLL